MFYKYEFTSEKQADELLEKIVLKDFSAVKLGFIMITPDTFTKGGKSRNDAIYNKKYSVDILFNMQEPESLKPYRITLGKNKSSHHFAGVIYTE